MQAKWQLQEPRRDEHLPDNPFNRQAKVTDSRGNVSKISEAKMNIWIIFKTIIPSQRQQESLELQAIPEQRLGFSFTTQKELRFAHCCQHSWRNLLSKLVNVNSTSSSDDTIVTHISQWKQWTKDLILSKIHLTSILSTVCWLWSHI